MLLGREGHVFPGPRLARASPARARARARVPLQRGRAPLACRRSMAQRLSPQRCCRRGSRERGARAGARGGEALIVRTGRTLVQAQGYDQAMASPAAAGAGAADPAMIWITVRFCHFASKHRYGDVSWCNGAVFGPTAAGDGPVMVATSRHGPGGV